MGKKEITISYTEIVDLCTIFFCFFFSKKTKNQNFQCRTHNYFNVKNTRDLYSWSFFTSCIENSLSSSVTVLHNGSFQFPFMVNQTFIQFSQNPQKVIHLVFSANAIFVVSLKALEQRERDLHQWWWKNTPLSDRYIGSNNSSRGREGGGKLEISKHYSFITILI